MDKIKLDLAIYSLPRSGSTMLINFLRTIFIYDNGEVILRHWDPHACATNLHNFEIPNKFVIINMRDFRDVGASRWRAMHAKYDCGTVVNKMNKDLVRTQGKENRMFTDLLDKIIENNPHALIIKYEDYWDNIDVLVEKIEKYLGLKIPDELLEVAKKEVTFDRYKSISDSQGDKFHIVDKKTNIHAKHMYTGKPGTWKDFVEEEDWDDYQKTIKEVLERYEYE